MYAVLFEKLLVLTESIEWDHDDSRGLGWDQGTVKVGSGHTFNEIARSASEQTPSKIIASGWTPTVGVAVSSQGICQWVCLMGLC